jgi:hypothetical protein
MTDKFTPGPWNNYAGDDIYCVYDATGKKICQIEPVDIVFWNAVHREQADANEALIAAAPELLQAMEALLSEHAVPSSGCKDRPAYEQARAAIAKARGL